MFFANQRLILVLFSSVAPHRGQLAAKCHPRWQLTRRLAVSQGLGRHQIQTRDCRTTVWCATIEPPRLPLKFSVESFLTLQSQLVNLKKTLKGSVFLQSTINPKPSIGELFYTRLICIISIFEKGREKISG
jgi:hypothetical protein